MGLKFYETYGSPPSIAVSMALKYLNLKPEVISIDLVKEEHLKPEFRKKNPNGEVPCLEDNGFCISESAAILQYLADQYKKDDSLYPTDLKKRAVVNQLLAFYNTTLYKAILDYWVFPVFLGSPKTEWNTQRLKRAVLAFDTILKENGTLYAAGDNVTIADLSLIIATCCLEAIEYDLPAYPNVNGYYKNFQKNQPELWKIANAGLVIFKEFVKNPPPIHPPAVL